MNEPLSSSLGRIRTEAKIRQAELIRDHPASEERIDEARKMIRAVLYEFAVGKIEFDDRDEILQMLQFARKTCIIQPEEPIATYQDEQVERGIRDEIPKKQQTFFFMP